MTVSDIIQQLTSNQITETMIVNASMDILTPLFLIVFFSTIFIFLIVGLFSVKKSGRGKYLLIWFISSLVSGIILLMVILLPNTLIKFIT